MKYFCIYFFLLTSIVGKCQDKIYFLDGSTKTGKVKEIGPEQIILKSADQLLEIPRPTILLIEFRDGTFEKINSPENDVTVKADKKENFYYKQPKTQLYNYNLLSINTLALCNADISAFYERILPAKKIGLGVMGAYNFNLNANAINTFIAILDNAKKRYDLGGYINFYPARFEKRTYLHMGIMLKYTSFSYTSIIQDTARVGNTVAVNSVYKPATGSQLATIFTIGTQSDVTKNFFVKTIFGIGAFKLNGEYKTQFNKELNRNSSSAPVNINFLPKFYFGINLGFKL